MQPLFSSNIWTGISCKSAHTLVVWRQTDLNGGITMKRTLLALMLVLSLTSLAGCGNNNTVTDKDTANNNPTSSGYQADEDGSVTSNGKTDTTDKTTTTTTKDNVKTDTKGVGDDVKSAADNVVDAADDVVDGAADAVEGVAEGAKDVVNGDDNTNTKTTANSSTKTTTTKGTTK